MEIQIKIILTEGTFTSVFNVIKVTKPYKSRLFCLLMEDPDPDPGGAKTDGSGSGTLLKFRLKNNFAIFVPLLFS